MRPRTFTENILISTATVGVYIQLYVLFCVCYVIIESDDVVMFCVSGCKDHGWDQKIRWTRHLLFSYCSDIIIISDTDKFYFHCRGRGRLLSGEWYWCDYNTDGRSCSAGRMPFWKKDKENGKAKEKVNYKARLEHKQYLVRNYYLSLHWMWRSLVILSVVKQLLFSFCLLYFRQWLVMD